MSLLQFQTGLAELIRLPESNRGIDLPNFLERFSLTDIERNRLTKLAGDPNVTKYGNSMAGVRWETPEMQLRLAHRLIPKSALEHIYRDLFEPQAVRVHLHDLTDRFLECLLEDPEARKVLIQAAPSSVFDVLQFERLQLAFYRGDITIEKETVLAGSVLRHTAFRTLELAYDVPAFILALSEETELTAVNVNKGGPDPRRLTVLFTADNSGPGARYFEIDETVRQFLDALRRDPLAQIELPSSYSDLVKLGMCKP